MKQFNLKLTNVGNASPSILIDGKPVKVKKMRLEILNIVAKPKKTRSMSS